MKSYTSKIVYFLIRIFLLFIDLISIVAFLFFKRLYSNRVRILCYHQIKSAIDTKFVCNNNSRFIISDAIFFQQMSYLSHANFNVITLDQFIEYREKNTNPLPNTVIITFDDGTLDNYVIAFKILQSFNFNGTFFPITDYINGDKLFSWVKPGKISITTHPECKKYWFSINKDDILEMSSRGSCFGSHTNTHCNLKKVENDRIDRELKESKQILEKLLNKPIECFSYPYGIMSKSLQAAVKNAGYKVAVSLISGSNTINTNPYALRRIIIYRQDSLSRFKRKVKGYYDWTEVLLPLFEFGRRFKDTLN